MAGPIALPLKGTITPVLKTCNGATTLVACARKASRVRPTCSSTQLRAQPTRRTAGLSLRASSEQPPAPKRAPRRPQRTQHEASHTTRCAIAWKSGRLTRSADHTLAQTFSEAKLPAV